MKTKTLEETISKGRQSVVATRHLEVGGLFKVRLTVKSDAYKFQCSASAHVWDEKELRWNHVYSIPFTEMTTPPELAYVSRQIGWGEFAGDTVRLLSMVHKILG